MKLNDFANANEISVTVGTAVGLIIVDDPKCAPGCYFKISVSIFTGQLSV